MKLASNNNLPLIVILGPTASGKSAVAMELASKIGGEIVCADSRTVYRGMDVCTAKPTAEDQSKIRHWCLDLVDPNQPFSVADFQREAQLAIADIRKRGKYPIMVGGSGLYIDSVIFNFDLRSPANPSLRQSLKHKTVEELIDYCNNNNIKLPENKFNRRHLIRTIETNGATVVNRNIVKNTILIGVDVDKTTIRDRIENRIKQMIDDGLIRETEKIYSIYGSGLESNTANSYSLVKQYLDGQINQDQLIKLATIRDMQLVKKQRTWFKRNPHIIWMQREKIVPFLMNKLGLKNE